MEKTLAAIFSLGGVTLSDAERSFFRQSDPLGFILFGRNIENPNQLKALTADLKNTLGRDCPILIDQEGGRVQRLKPPLWRQYPPMREFGKIAEDAPLPQPSPQWGEGVLRSPKGEVGRVGGMEVALESLRFTVLQMAEELRDCGINVNCAPVLDVLTDQTHDAIGNRAFSSDPDIVARLGLCVARNFLAAGITPAIKHMPGHGRATLDSHHDLPRVDASYKDLLETDFKPFKILAKSDAAPGLWGMMSHIIYEGIDPNRPVTVSPESLKKVIREDIGFDGFLLSDDLDMKALDIYGDIPLRACLTVGAGVDAALYCWADLKIMEKIAESVPKLRTDSVKRLQKAEEFRKLKTSS
jgi:beta-N-acetylhexosaminidase